MSPGPEFAIPNPELDALVRRVDEDRWLASRFAPPHARAKLISLYAVAYEMARVRELAREPGIAAIRLAWWREAIAEMAQGQPARAQPALRALQHAWGPDVDAHAFAAIAEASLDGASSDETEALLEASAGSVMRLALRACAPAEIEAPFVAAGACAWGYLRLARSGPAEARESFIARADAAYAQAKPLAAALSSAAFPAVGYVALVPAYLRALRARRAVPPLLVRQWRLVAAAATGRV